MERLSDQAIADMTPEERLELIERLWESLDDTPPLTQEQTAELDRRLEHLDSDIENGVTWEQLKAELSQRRR